MNRLVLEGTPEAKLKQIETVINRMLRRVNVVRSSSYLTNFGMHGYVAKSDDNGIVVRDMIPIGGQISYIYLFIEGIISQSTDKDKRAELIVAIEEKDQLGLSKGIYVKEGAQESPVRLDVVGGSRLLVKTSKPLEGVWYGLVIDPVPILRSTETPGGAVEIVE